MSWIKDLAEANKETSKWLTILICVTVGLVLGATVTVLLLSDRSITIRIDLPNGIIEVNGEAELPNGVVYIENSKSYFLTANGEKIPLREFLESQGYKVIWDNEKQTIIATK